MKLKKYELKAIDNNMTVQNARVLQHFEITEQGTYYYDDNYPLSAFKKFLQSSLNCKGFASDKYTILQQKYDVTNKCFITLLECVSKNPHSGVINYRNWVLETDEALNNF